MIGNVVTLPHSSQLVIELADLGKRFGTHWVLAHADLVVRRGEVVALFGGNGSGKSTLLKLIATLLSPSAGVVRVFGLSTDTARVAIRRRLRFLSHEKQLYGALTVTEQLRLMATLTGMGAADGDRAIAALLERFGLEAVRSLATAALSEGMQKRVALARLCLGEEPELVLMDEPHPTLDTAGRALLDALIAEWRARGATLLIASHDHAEVLRHADRVVHVRAGSLHEASVAGARPVEAR
ncbi:MAG: ABC transporter ATP-binding protein [Deltaproteobacteria bacterium]|nr:ABC transporter ATP-binding protein [Deltaproteobacteria bacterium]